MRTPFGASSPRSLSPVLWAALALTTCTAPARGGDGPAAFAVPKEVRAVLDAHCDDCHAERGNPIKHFGDLDPGLGRFGIDQTGAIKQFLA